MPVDPQQQILAAITAFIQGRAIAAAADLGLADLLAAGPLNIDTLAERTGTHARSLYRMMRALESAGIFTQVSQQVFANTPASECLRTDVPGSLRAPIRLALSPGLGEYDAWAGFSHSLRTGEPAFDHVFGYNYWKFLERHPDKSAIANEAQRSFTALVASAIVEGYDWGRFPVIADIGGGTGALLASILDRYPASRGILLDLPEVVSQAVPHDRTDPVGGDFFKGVPPGANAYLLRGVLHDWAEPQSLTILSNIRSVIQPAGRLAIIEGIITDDPEAATAKWVDLQMLTVVGGEKRTAGEYCELLVKAGFELEESIATKSLATILIGKPI